MLVSWTGSPRQRTIDMVLRVCLDTDLLCKYVGENLAPGKADQVASSGEAYRSQSACAHIYCGRHIDLLSMAALQFISLCLDDFVNHFFQTLEVSITIIILLFFKQLIGNPFKPRTNSNIKGVHV